VTKSGTKQKINGKTTREKLSFICGVSVKLDQIFPEGVWLFGRFKTAAVGHAI
jgi:hypothetical protein